MKKFLATLFLAMFSLSIIGCSGDKDKKDKDKDKDKTEKKDKDK